MPLAGRVVNQVLSLALRPSGRKPYGNDDHLIA
jgi:hypothetical protein